MTDQSPSSVLGKISFFQNQRGEVPNQILAMELAEARDRAGIKEIANHIWDKNQNIQSDCLKVLYEIGYIAPDLIADYVIDFLKLLNNKNNRMVWGAMIALATIADLRADDIWPQIDLLMQTIDSGSVITTVWGIKALAKVAATDVVPTDVVPTDVGSTGSERRQKIFPFLLRKLETCIPRDVPLHAENMLCAVDETVKVEFISILESRFPELSPAQQTRIKKVLKDLNQPKIKVY